MKDRLIIIATWICAIAFCLTFWGFVISAAFGQTVIDNDLGGDVDEYAARIDAETGTILVRGQCMSACTMWLALGDRVCTYRNAQWGFHGAQSADPKMSAIVEPYSNQRLAQSYPPAIRERFESSWSKLRGPQSLRVISGAEMIKMGVKECPKHGE